MHLEPTSMPKRRGRPPTTTETITAESRQLIELAKSRDPVSFEQALTRHINSILDSELENLATYILSDREFDNVNHPEVRGPMGRGDSVGALMALTSRMRRKFAKALRDHQRGEDDVFTDQCLVE